MKKWIAALLSLVMLLSFSASLAEDVGAAIAAAQAEKVTLGSISINGEFTLQCGIPEGYRPIPIMATREQVIAVLESEDPQAPVMMLSVAYDETYSDVDRMNDLDADALELLEQTFIDNDPGVEITYGETGLGTLLMIARHDTEDQDYVSFLSVYKGYFVEFALTPSEAAEDKNLTDEQLALSIQVLTDLDFVPGVLRAGNELQAIAGQMYVGNIRGYNAEDETVQIETLKSITIPAETVAGLEVGDTLTWGDDESVVVESVEKLFEEGDDSVLVNGTISLIVGDDGDAIIFDADHQIMEIDRTLSVSLSDDFIFYDGVDPATGEMLTELTTHNAEEFVQMVEAAADDSFTSDNIYMMFNEAGELQHVERLWITLQ